MTDTPAPRRRWLPWVIIGGVLVVLVALAMLVSVAVGIVQSRLAPDQPLLTGEQASGIAAQPLECSGSCFDSEDIPSTQIGLEDVAEFGIDATPFPWGTYDSITAGALKRQSLANWTGSDSGPDSCFFVPTNAPLSFSDNEESEDLIDWTGTLANAEKSNALDQSVRFFADSTTASEYLVELRSHVEDCDSVSTGSGRNFYSADVSPAPELDLPDSVTGIGWIRTGDPGLRWRSYVVDLQRGNLVVRTRLLTDGSIREAEFRQLVEDLAVQLEEIEPNVTG